MVSESYISRMLNRARIERPKVYDIFQFDLGMSRENMELSIAGNYIYVQSITELGSIKIRLNEISNDYIDLIENRTIKTPFYRIFLTNLYQSNKNISIIIGTEGDLFSITDGVFQEGNNSLKIDGFSTTQNSCGAADTEYSGFLFARTKMVGFKARGGTIKLTFQPGVVGTSIWLQDGDSFTIDNIRLRDNRYYYYQSPVAGTILEIIWGI